MRVITDILDVCRDIKSDRNLDSILHHMHGELNELHDEVYSKVIGRKPNEDGVIGEAVDVILCAVDIIYKDNPTISEAEISRVVDRKLAKWRKKYEEKAE